MRSLRSRAASRVPHVTGSPTDASPPVSGRMGRLAPSWHTQRAAPAIAAGIRRSRARWAATRQRVEQNRASRRLPGLMGRSHPSRSHVLTTSV